MPTYMDTTFHITPPPERAKERDSNKHKHRACERLSHTQTLRARERERAARTLHLCTRGRERERTLHSHWPVWASKSRSKNKNKPRTQVAAWRALTLTTKHESKKVGRKSSSPALAVLAIVSYVAKLQVARGGGEVSAQQPLALTGTRRIRKQSASPALALLVFKDSTHPGPG